MEETEDGFIIIEVDVPAVRRWRLVFAYLLVVLASRRQWGCLGNWLKEYKNLKWVWKGKVVVSSSPFRRRIIHSLGAVLFVDQGANKKMHRKLNWAIIDDEEDVFKLAWQIVGLTMRVQCGAVRASWCVVYIMRCVAPVIDRGLIKRLDMFRSCYMLVKQSEAMKAKQCKWGQCLVKQSIIA